MHSYAKKPGEWEIVDGFPDFKVQIVDSFGDFKIQFCDNWPGVQGALGSISTPYHLKYYS